MSEAKRKIMVKAKKLHDEAVRQALEDIAFACKRHGFKADISVAIELQHDLLPDAGLLHLSGNRNDPLISLFSKAIKVMSEELEQKDVFECLEVMQELSDKGTLNEFKFIEKVMGVLGAMAKKASKMIDEDASKEEILQAMADDMDSETRTWQ